MAKRLHSGRRLAGSSRGPAAACAVLCAGLFLCGPAAAAPSGLDIRPVLLVAGPAPGVPFSAPRGIAFDPTHPEVLLANSGAHRIEVYSLDGERRARFIHRVQGTGGAWVDGVPLALAVDRAGRIFVSDLMCGYVDILDYRGRSVGRLQLPAPSDSARAAAGGAGYGPGALAFAPDGSLLAAHRGAEGRITRFDPDLKPAGTWGTPGTGAGQLCGITGLAVTRDGEVVTVCLGTKTTVQVFSPAGEYLRGFGVHDIGFGNFSIPSGVAITADGRIWVGDEVRQILQVFEPSGEFVQSVGSGGRGPGQFQYPSALASDGKGLVAVAERQGNRFQLLRVQ